MSQPRYQEVNENDIPVIEKNGAKIRLVAGQLDGHKGPVTEIANQPLYMDISLEPNTTFDLPVESNHFALVYLFEGEGLFGVDEKEEGEFVQSVRMLVLSEGDHLRVQTGPGSPARFMLMAGAPFREPIAPYGPFVMTTQEEIQQALRDLRNGTFVKRFGYLRYLIFWHTNRYRSSTAANIDCQSSAVACPA